MVACGVRFQVNDWRKLLLNENPWAGLSGWGIAMESGAFTNSAPLLIHYGESTGQQGSDGNPLLPPVPSSKRSALKTTEFPNVQMI